MIEAKIIKDSINPYDVRLTTWILTYPRWIHSEIMTHRHFSRNASSSRARPISKVLKEVDENPATPESWGSNQSGMQAGKELTNDEFIYYNKELYENYDEFVIEDEDSICGKIKIGKLDAAKLVWNKASKCAIFHAEQLEKIGVHKQLTNRIVEPFSHITVLLSGTDFENFFALRAQKDAQPEFQLLAYKMLELYNNNIPDKVDTGEWHIPFSDKMPEGITLEQKLKIAVARCARLSYMTFDGEINPEKDYELYDKLAFSGHYSAFEHCAKVIDPNNEKDTSIDTLSNFRFTWIQYRKMLDNECRKDSRVIEKTF
jgi:thymidylate synthase ThyX